MEKKREKELLQNIFYQLGMLSWDVLVSFDGLIIKPGNVVERKNANPVGFFLLLIFAR